GTCSPATGLCSNPSAPNGIACNDGNACTVGERCGSGSCLPPASFMQPVGSPLAGGTNPTSIAVGDWNEDGTLDLAVANNGSNNVTILLGNGSGGFSEAAGSPVAVGTLPVSGVFGDWNLDGTADLAVVNQVSNSVMILLGNGSGGFSQATGSPVAV